MDKEHFNEMLSEFFKAIKEKTLPTLCNNFAGLKYPALCLVLTLK